MAITRAAVEAEVVSELGPLMTLAGKSVTTAGSNPDLNGPLAFALQALGVTPTDPGAVTDADMAGIANSQFVTVCQIAEYYGIKKCLNSAPMPNERAQDRQQDWNDMFTRYQRTLADLANQLQGYLNIKVNPTISGCPPLRFPTPGHPRFAIGHGRIDH